MGIKEKSYDVRYFTYYLKFPDGEIWCDQAPFIHDLQFELKNTTFGKDPGLARDILVKGECHWKDHNGVEHRIVVDTEKKPKKWGRNGQGQARIKR